MRGIAYPQQCVPLDRCLEYSKVLESGDSSALASGFHEHGSWHGSVVARAGRRTTTLDVYT